jgi:hypothetical protein
LALFANRTLALKETMNSTKHLKKNENYNEILDIIRKGKRDKVADVTLYLRGKEIKILS